MKQLKGDSPFDEVWLIMIRQPLDHADTTHGFFRQRIFVAEHRYFGKSVPDTINWEYLTVANAASDHHHIVDLFNDYDTGKWIRTG